MDDEEFEFLKINEAAALLGIPVAALRWWRSKGNGPTQPQVRSPRQVRCADYARGSTRNGTAALSSCKTMSTPNACTSSGRRRTRLDEALHASGSAVGQVVTGRLRRSTGEAPTRRN